MKKFYGWALVFLMCLNTLPAVAATKEEIFLTGKDWKETMTVRAKFMALLPPSILFDEYDIKLHHSLPEYIQLIDLILRFNPQLDEEDVANIFASAVYRFEPESRVALKTMEMNFLQGNLEIKPLHKPLLSLDGSSEIREDL